jgi:hypothetical protein
LVQDLDEAVKDVNLLGEHEEESSQKITKLVALCKRLREDDEKLKEEKTALEVMIQSRDDLIMEMAEEYGLNHMGENVDAYRVPLHLLHLHLRLLPCLTRSSKKKPLWRWFSSKRPLWRMR